MNKPKRVRKLLSTNTLYIFVLVSFILPIVYLLLRIIFPDVLHLKNRTDADYALMLLQCLLGVVVLHIPMLFEKKFKLNLPVALYALYMIFLYAAIFLGEVGNFYYVIPYWDVILHCASSIMTGFFAYMLIAILNSDVHVKVNLSSFFMAIFAFSFSMMIGSVWEIYEFLCDEFIGTNMQKFRTMNGVILAGHKALTDTMKDLIIDALGALIAAAIGWLSLTRKKGSIYEYYFGGTPSADSDGETAEA